MSQIVCLVCQSTSFVPENENFVCENPQCSANGLAVPRIAAFHGDSLHRNWSLMCARISELEMRLQRKRANDQDTEKYRRDVILSAARGYAERGYTPDAIAANAMRLAELLYP